MSGRKERRRDDGLVPDVKERRGGQRGAAKRRNAARGRLARWLYRLALAALVVVAIPLCLTLVYAIPGVHPVSMLMLRDILTRHSYERRWTPLDEISPKLVRSVMTSEDARFCLHDGIDWRQMDHVISDALAGEETRGASTITMQSVKNLFLWNGRSFLRKALEAPLALYFDAVLPKRRIMEIYLNIAEWGPHLYGAEAAAEHYYKRPAADLSGRQAALMAVTLPNPRERNPARPSSEVRRLAAIIGRRARRAGQYDQCLEQTSRGKRL